MDCSFVCEREHTHTPLPSYRLRRNCFQKESYIFSQIHLYFNTSHFWSLQDGRQFNIFRWNQLLTSKTCKLGYFGESTVLSNCDPPSMFWFLSHPPTAGCKNQSEEKFTSFQYINPHMMFKSGLRWQFWKSKQFNCTNITHITKVFRGHLTNQQHLMIPWKKILIQKRQPLG